jgi:putative transposase
MGTQPPEGGTPTLRGQILLEKNGMYDWRKMSRTEQIKTLIDRRAAKHPRHSPVHVQSAHTDMYHITAACYEHQPIIGQSDSRLQFFLEALLDAVSPTPVRAWAVLPNHYHLLASSPDILAVLKRLGLLHGQTSFLWNGEDGTRGRKVWCKSMETAMKSERHTCVAMNYIHNNPVKHGVCEKWQAWPYSSAGAWLETVGREAAGLFWREYPVKDYGCDWDV